MKVLGMCFLAFLLFLILPVSAQEYDYDVPEMEEEMSETEEEKEAEQIDEADDIEEASLEEVEEEPLEAMVEEIQPEQKADEVQTAEPPAQQPEVSVAVEVAEEAEDDEEDEADSKKFRLSITNGFSHGFARERKNFGYNLRLGLSYSLPFKMSFGAGVGLTTNYRYGMEAGVPLDDGMISDSSVDHASFDGTPLSMNLSMPFPLFWEIGGTAGVTVVLPFTSTLLWEQNKVYAMLGANVGLARPFRVAKETTLTTSFGFNYQKTFAKYDARPERYQNSYMYYINNHEFGLGLNLALAYRAVTFSVGGGYGIMSTYGKGGEENLYGDGDTREITQYQKWSYSPTFSTSLAYNYKDWNFTGGVQTAAPEYDSGNYTGFTPYAGGPDVKSGTYNYPFKARYTRVFLNIGYGYSF